MLPPVPAPAHSAAAGAVPGFLTGPYEWRGRAVLSPDIVQRGGKSRLGLLALLLLAGGAVLFCGGLWVSILTALLPLVVILFVIAYALGVTKGAAGVARSLFKGAAALVAVVISGVAQPAPSRPVLLVRLDVGMPEHVTVAIGGVSEGVRQGDEVVARGFRFMGVVRGFSAKNLTTSRRFFDAGAIARPVVTVLLPAYVALLWLTC